MSSCVMELRYRAVVDNQPTWHTAYREALLTVVLHPSGNVTPPEAPEWFLESCRYVLKHSYAPILIYALGNQGSADHFSMARQAIEYTNLDETLFALPDWFDERPVYFVDEDGQKVEKDGLPDLCCDLILGGTTAVNEAAHHYEITMPDARAEQQWQSMVRAIREYDRDPNAHLFVRFVSTITDNPVLSMIDAMRDLVLR